MDGLHGLYGGADTGRPVADVEAAARVRVVGKTVGIKVHPEAPHGFDAEYRPSCREGAAMDGRQGC